MVAWLVVDYKTELTKDGFTTRLEALEWLVKTAKMYEPVANRIEFYINDGLVQSFLVK